MQSPLKLFRSLKHGDPQAVAVTAVVLFFLSVCWFSWTLLAPRKTEPLPLGGGRQGRQSAAVDPSLREVLDIQRAYLTPGDVPNPFFREPPAQPTPRERPPRNPPPANPNTGNNPNPNKPSPNPQPNPPPVATPSTRPLTLCYLGLLKRPDGNTVALISIAEENSQRFIRIGDQLASFTIIAISPEGIQIQEPNGPAIFLPRGNPQRFEVPL